MKPIYEKINKQEGQSFFLEKIERPYFTDLWHFHPEVEILYVQEGYGTRYVGDSINNYYPGDIILVGSNTPHVWVSNNEYYSPESKLFTKGVCIQFHDTFIDNLSQTIPEFVQFKAFLAHAKRGIEFPEMTKNKVKVLLENLENLHGVERVISLFEIISNMSSSPSIRFLSSPNYKTDVLNPADKDRMEIIYRYVIKNYPRKTQIEEVASLVNLTPHSFCRYFKLRTSKVFSSFVNEVRIGNACKLLIEEKLSISQICYETGYNYLSNFNRQFKKIKGITPTEFIQKYKGMGYLH